MSTPAPNRIALQGSHAEPLKISWRPFFWITILFLISYAVVLERLAKQWLTDSDMSHGLFVPILDWLYRLEKTRRTGRPETFAESVWPRADAAGRRATLRGTSQPRYLRLCDAGNVRISLVGSQGFYLLRLPTLRMLIYPLVLMLLMIPMPGFASCRASLSPCRSSPVNWQSTFS